MSQRISDMTNASPLDGDELIPVVQDGANRKATPSQLSDFLLGDLDFWPLEGTASLIDDLTIDGDGNSINLTNFDELDFLSDGDLSFTGNNGGVPGIVAITNSGGTAQIEMGLPNTDFRVREDGIFGITDVEVSLTVDDGAINESSIVVEPDSVYLLSDSVGDLGSLLLTPVDSELRAFAKFSLFAPEFVRAYGTETRQIRNILWYDNSVNNSAGGTPSTTNQGRDVFGALVDASASIEIWAKATGSDGSECYGAKWVFEFLKDGSANPTLVAGTAIYEQFNNSEILSLPISDMISMSNSGANVLLSLKTPSNRTYRWTIWADINISHI